MANTSSSVRRAALLVSAVATLGALTACGSADGTTTAPPQPPPTSHDRTAAGSPSEQGAATEPAPSPSQAAGGTEKPARCHTGELRAEVGRMDPGAGQRNVPIVLTNASARTCTVYGYPGAAFVDASGEQLGPDPERAPGSPARVTLAPGDSAWAGLSYSSPEISGARTARPAALLVTPPDEREPIEVPWTAGAVPVSGNASSVSLTVFAPGSGPGQS
ncbi:DUF4232 domain-containing protein [Streptomyces sp. P17]|uniref:DUF4232 domain-containing protein n=1 Tax=Streptomyces sp. P17 TaxID=3074716 RepID=UPI0028F419DF|nr:DUF4232 domain-containing protein [Streptomyces sp. P17]MDT9695769.1 DUF4232 domain-containing protein [Streptomyces sp. P17]